LDPRFIRRSGRRQGLRTAPVVNVSATGVAVGGRCRQAPRRDRVPPGTAR